MYNLSGYIAIEPKYTKKTDYLTTEPFSRRIWALPHDMVNDGIGFGGNGGRFPLGDTERLVDTLCMHSRV